MILIGQADLGSGKFGLTKRQLISLVEFKFSQSDSLMFTANPEQDRPSMLPSLANRKQC